MKARQSVPVSSPPAPPAVVERFLDALRHGRFDGVGDLLAPDVWLRVLLVKRVHESSTAAEAVEAFRSWVGSPHGRQMIAADHATMAGREFLRFRFRVRPAWAPDRWHVIEQAGFCKVGSGRITRLDLACTGYFPMDEWMPGLLPETGAPRTGKGETR